MPRFAFSFAPAYRIAGLPFGIAPRTTGVAIEDGSLTIRFGPWHLSTSLDNVASCEPSGPYAFAKTAGPAHLSLVDHGMTCATNGDAGLCIRFSEPVRGLDPWGSITSPGVTVTVDRIAELNELLTGGAPEHHDSDPVVMEQPLRVVKRLLAWPMGMTTAALRYPGIVVAVSRRSNRAGDIDAMRPMASRSDGLQPLESGVGSVFVRRYTARIKGADCGPEDIIERFATNLNVIAPDEIAEFVEQAPGSAASLDQEFEIRMPGPWNGPVRVVDRTATTIRLATMEGHMEAGEIEFSARRPDGGGKDTVEFQVESVARSGDHLFRAVYEWLRIAQEMQLFMWVTVCRGVASLIGGEIVGKITVETVRMETEIIDDAS